MSIPIRSSPSSSSSGSSGPASASFCSGIGPAMQAVRRFPDFELNQPEAKGASVLVARRNFGCGSSREHAPWALEDYGFRVIIAPSFADIFYNNCFKNGMLPIVLSEAEVDDLFHRASARPGYTLTADLEKQHAFRRSWVGAEVRGRAFPPALLAPRPRRHRPHARARGQNRRLRTCPRDCRVATLMDQQKFNRRLLFAVAIGWAAQSAAVSAAVADDVAVKKILGGLQNAVRCRRSTGRRPAERGVRGRSRGRPGRARGCQPARCRG